MHKLVHAHTKAWEGRLGERLGCLFESIHSRPHFWYATDFSVVAEPGIDLVNSELPFFE